MFPNFRGKQVLMRDEHGLEKVWLFPTLGILYEEFTGAAADDRMVIDDQDADHGAQLCQEPRRLSNATALANVSPAVVVMIGSAFPPVAAASS